MAGADRQLYIEIVIDDGGAVKKMAQVDAAAAKVGQTAKTSAVGITTMEQAITRASAAGSFWGTSLANLTTAAIGGLKSGIMGVISEAARYDATMTGLATVSKAFKVDVDAAKGAAQQLAADGLMTVGEAAAGLKNLLSAGFGLPQAIELMKGFKDIAAFNRQGSLDFGQAIVSASEGIKNQNSILVDNAGLTKNLSVIMKEAGMSIADMSKISSDAGIRQKFFGGLMKEMSFSAGDAAKMAQQYSGQLASLKTAITTLAQEAGHALIPMALKVVAVLKDMVPIARGALDVFKQLPEPVQSTAVAVTMLGTAAGTAAVALRTMGVPVGDMLTKFPSIGGAASRLATVLMSPAGLVAALGLLGIAFTELRVGQIEKQAQTWADASAILGRGAKNLKEAEQVVAAFVGTGGNLSQLRAKFSELQTTQEAQAVVGASAKAVTLEMANAAVTAATQQGKYAMAITTATIALDKNRAVSTGATIAEAELHAKRVKTVGANQQLTLVYDEIRKKATLVQVAQEQITAADKAYQAALAGKKDALTLQIEAMDKTGKSTKELADMYTIAEDHVKRLKGEIDDAAKVSKKAAEDYKKLGEDALEIYRRQTLGMRMFIDDQGALVSMSREHWAQFLKAQTDATFKMREDFRDLNEERHKKAQAQFDNELEIWIEANEERTALSREALDTIQQMEASTLQKRLRIVHREYDERRAALNRFSQFYKENLENLLALEEAAAIEVTKIWADEQVTRSDLYKNAADQVGGLASAFQGLLGEVGDGRFSEIVKEIVNIASAFSKASEAASIFADENASAMDKVMATIMAVQALLQATGSGSTSGRIVGGALTGAQIGGAIVPGYGHLVGAAAGALIGYFRGRNQGRDMIEDWVEETFGTFEGLRDKLSTLGEGMGEELWVNLTQRVGRGDAKGAAEAIEAITAALAAQERQQQETAAAAVATQEAVTASQQAMLQPVIDNINGLTAEYNRLWETIKDERPEEVMGDVEKATRERMEAIAGERKNAIEELKTLTETLSLGFDDVLAKLDEFIDRLGNIPSPVIRPTMELPNPEGRDPMMERPESYHAGGSVARYHTGGRVLPFLPRAHNGLAIDEVPIVAQTGEFMMSRADVSNAGGMDAVKRHRGSGPAPVINLTVQINKPYVRDRQSMQELAREIKNVLKEDLRGSNVRLRA